MSKVTSMSNIIIIIIIIIIIMALRPFCWALAAFSVSWYYTQSVGVLDGGSASHKDATYTEDNTNRINAHIHIQALSGIRTHDPMCQGHQLINKLHETVLQQKPTVKKSRLYVTFHRCRFLQSVGICPPPPEVGRSHFVSCSGLFANMSAATLVS
jgi:hypothetical protein